MTFLLPSPSSDFKVPSKKDTAGFLHLIIHLMIFFDGSPYKFQFHVACSKQIDGDPYCQALDLNIPGLQRANILSRLFGSWKLILRQIKTTDCFAVQFVGGKKMKEMAGSENGLEPANNIYTFWTNLRVSNNVLQFRNPEGYFLHSTSQAGILSIQDPDLQMMEIPDHRKAFLPPQLAGSAFLQWTPWLAQPGQLSQGDTIRACASAVGSGKSNGKRVNVFLEKHLQKLARPARRMTHFFSRKRGLSGFPSGQDGSILPARGFPRWLRKRKKVLFLTSLNKSFIIDQAC